MSELQSLLAAVGIQLLTALLVVWLALRADPDRPVRARAHASPADPPPADPPPADPDPPAARTTHEPIDGAVRATLTRINEPHRSADPDRLIQTEVLLPGGASARAQALAKLVAGLLALGITLAAAIVGSVRGIAWFVRRVSGS